ncbi:MAG: hypothetical protein K8F31_05315 [Roseovarius sp.]|nr:hypothetical protein [Roseovarius sp.]
MDYARKALAQDRERAFGARAARARGWARLAYAALVAMFLFAAWQDRALAPPVHDGMKVTAERIVWVTENTDEVRAYIRGLMRSPSGSSAKPQHDPVTRFLLQFER